MGPQGQRDRLCPWQQSSQNLLSLLCLQQHPTLPALSATTEVPHHRCPLESRIVDGGNLKQYYPEAEIDVADVETDVAVAEIDVTFC